MLGISFFKGLPTEYILRYRSGRIIARGQGLAFYYASHNTQIVAVPTASSDGNFIFNEVTRDFQSLAVQGQFTYRISAPEVAAQLLNFSLNPRTRTSLSGDPERLANRVANVIQTQTRALIGARTLGEVLADAQNMAGQVLESVRANNLLAALGVELLGVFFVGVKPTPEVSKALEVFAGLEPRLVLALAMRELGTNAKRIGNLNITPEILASLLQNGTPQSKGDVSE